MRYSRVVRALPTLPFAAETFWVTLISLQHATSLQYLTATCCVSCTNQRGRQTLGRLRILMLQCDAAQINITDLIQHRSSSSWVKAERGGKELGLHSVLQCVAVCCSVLRCAAACCSVLHCVAVCCCVFQYVAMCCSANQHHSSNPTSQQRVSQGRRGMQRTQRLRLLYTAAEIRLHPLCLALRMRIAVCCSMVQCIA